VSVPSSLPTQPVTKKLKKWHNNESVDTTHAINATTDSTHLGEKMETHQHQDSRGKKDWVRNNFQVETKIPAYKSDLVKASQWIGLNDPNFMLEFLNLWGEHVEGFGKNKKPKTEKELGMEWRQRLKQKQQSDSSTANEDAQRTNKKELENARMLAQLRYRQLKGQRKPTR